MSQAEATQVDLEEILSGLEKTIAKLAEGTAPLHELVSAHASAVRLLAEAGARLKVLEARAGEIAELIG